MTTQQARLVKAQESALPILEQLFPSPATVTAAFDKESSFPYIVIQTTPKIAEAFNRIITNPDFVTFTEGLLVDTHMHEDGNPKGDTLPRLYVDRNIADKTQEYPALKPEKVGRIYIHADVATNPAFKKMMQSKAFTVTLQKQIVMGSQIA